MNEEQAIKIVYEELIGKNSIPVMLNLRKFYSEESFTRLENAMIFLANLYNEKKYIPKKLASFFIDTSSDFERCYQFYSDQEQEKIFDLKERIIDLAHDIFDDD